MYQRTTLRFKRDYGVMVKYLSVVNGLIENNHLYVVDIDTWLFLDYDLNTGISELKADIQLEDYRGKLCWVEKILHIGIEFFILIRNYRGLVSINESGDVNYYELDHELGSDDSFYYMDMLIVDGLLYILPGYTNGLISIFNTEKHEFIKHISMDSLIVPQATHLVGRPASIWSYVFDDSDGNVIFCINKSNMICTLNLRTMLIETSIGNSESTLMMLSGVNRECIILENNSYHLSRYNKYKAEIEIVGDFKRRVKDQTWHGYQMAFEMDDMIAAIPEDMYSIEMIKDEEIIETLIMPKESKLIYEIRNYKGKFAKAIKDNNMIYLLPFSTNGMIVIDVDTHYMQFYELVVPQEYLMIKEMRKRELIKEGEMIGLSGFIQNVELSRILTIKCMGMAENEL